MEGRCSNHSRFQQWERWDVQVLVLTIEAFVWFFILGISDFPESEIVVIPVCELDLKSYTLPEYHLPCASYDFVSCISSNFCSNITWLEVAMPPQLKLTGRTGIAQVAPLVQLLRRGSGWHKFNSSRLPWHSIASSWQLGQNRETNPQIFCSKERVICIHLLHKERQKIQLLIFTVQSGAKETWISERPNLQVGVLRQKSSSCLWYDKDIKTRAL